MINDKKEREMSIQIPQTNEKLERLKIKKNFLEDCQYLFGNQQLKHIFIKTN